MQTLKLPSKTDDYDYHLDEDDGLFDKEPQPQELVARIPVTHLMSMGTARAVSPFVGVTRSSSVSGMTKAHRATARKRAVQAALLSYHHREVIHYTQGPRRWDGIRLGLNANHGEFPIYGDCSAMATWWEHNGLWIPYHIRDVVNHEHWASGYTGTMLLGGKRVIHLSNVIPGDCVLYGGGTGRHTAMCVGHRGSKPMVISHGSEAGPFYLPYDYRPDTNQWRRYI
jgi:hypothetical protein